VAITIVSPKGSTRSRVVTTPDVIWALDTGGPGLRRNKDGWRTPAQG